MSRTASGAPVQGALGEFRPRTGLGRPTPRSTDVLRPFRFLAARWRLSAGVLVGALAAAVVGYLVSMNPHAEPAHVAVSLRVAIIDALIFAGAYAQTNTGQKRMGAFLLAAGLFASVWLLNGANEPIPFTLGRLASGLAPTVFCFLMLSYPTGRLRSTGERWLVFGAGTAALIAWTILLLTTAQPSLATPLVRCSPHCPSNPLYVGSLDPGVAAVLKAALFLCWGVVACVTPVLLFRPLRHGVQPLRRSVVPVEMVAIANAVFWLAWILSREAESGAASAFGAAYVEIALAIPIVILAALFVERLSMGRALATFISRLAAHPETDPEVILADALRDKSLKIAYYRPEIGAHTDAWGHQVTTPEAGGNRAVVQIEHDNCEVATVSFDASLTDQAAFVEAAGSVAVMHIEATHLEADLIASNKELVASRLRLMEAADTERQRIERDLHDGVQQYVLALRLRLDLAAEAIRQDPDRGERMIGSIGAQVDDLLATLRSFAAGVYPSVLTDYGLRDALESVARSTPIEVSLQSFRIGRYPEDVEIAVYFCCLEAIQNVVKHGGPDAAVSIRLWHVANALSFDVRDSGLGFEPSAAPRGNGLINMHDRIEAVGGKLWVISRSGWGTSVQGRVPLD